MRLAKPQTKRVYVTAVDPDTGTSKTATVYGASPQEFVAWLKSKIGPHENSRKRRRALVAASD